MADYEPGKMDISVQQKTFSGFMKTIVWSCVIVGIALIFLAIVGI